VWLQFPRLRVADDLLLHVDLDHLIVPGASKDDNIPGDKGFADLGV
jgi:hypothetical protein